MPADAGMLEKMIAGGDGEDEKVDEEGAKEKRRAARKRGRQVDQAAPLNLFSSGAVPKGPVRPPQAYEQMPRPLKPPGREP